MVRSVNFQDQPAKPAGRDTRPRGVSSSGPMGAKPLEAASYILEMSLVLRNIANDTGLNFLAYLLDMAAEEADGVKQLETRRRSSNSATR